MPIDWITVVVNVAISTPAVGGLLGWLGKRQMAKDMAQHNEQLESLRAKYASELEAYRSDLEQSKKMLQGEIDKTLMVTKVHFETEFAALKEVFAKLSEVRLQIGGLRPFFDVVPADDTKEAKLERLAAVLSKTETAYNNLVAVSENLSPFYPPEIYAQIEECRKAAWFETHDIKTTLPAERFSSVWYEQGSKNLNRFLAAYSNVSNLIRERISKLAIVRGTR